MNIKLEKFTKFWIMIRKILPTFQLLLNKSFRLNIIE